MSIKSLQPTATVPNLRAYLPNPNTPWHVTPEVFNRMQPSGTTGSHYKCELKAGDIEWTFIQKYFEADRPENRSIKRAYCIHNPAATNQFEATIPSLEVRAKNPFFAPQWQKEDCAPLRKKTIERWKSQTTPYSPFSITMPGKRTDTYEHVKILPLVHGTRAATCDSICDIGFTFFGKHNLIHGEQELGSNTDLGYFGSGIYFTNSVRYATLDCYSDGNFFIGWVVMPEPYPVVANAPYDTSGNPKPKDMQKLEGLNAYEKYKAHYIPVAPIDPSQKMCCMYYPCATGQEPWVDEFAIFDSAQTLVRFWIELQIDLPKSIGESSIHCRSITSESPRPSRRASHFARQGSL